jgi:hypothetical protein
VAKELWAKLTFPSMKDFWWAVRSNQISNCPVTVEDIDNAKKIYGKDVAALKGKTIRKKIEAVSGTKLKIPKHCLSLHKEVYLTMNVFFVVKLPFFLTLSRKIDFASVLLTWPTKNLSLYTMHSKKFMLSTDAVISKSQQPSVLMENLNH